MVRLTNSQTKIINFIDRYTERNNRAPSIDVIAKAHYVTKSAILTKIEKLEQRGFLEKIVFEGQVLGYEIINPMLKANEIRTYIQNSILEIKSTVEKEIDKKHDFKDAMKLSYLMVRLQVFEELNRFIVGKIRELNKKS